MIILTTTGNINSEDINSIQQLGSTQIRINMKNGDIHYTNYQTEEERNIQFTAWLMRIFTGTM